MSSRLLRVSIPPLESVIPSPTATGSSVSPSARQLQTELRQTINRDMVATRSQDHTPVQIMDDKVLKEQSPTVPNSGKRKASHDEAGTVAKRKQAATKKKDVVVPRDIAPVGEEFKGEDHDEPEVIHTYLQESDEKDDLQQDFIRTRQSSSSSSRDNSIKSQKLIAVQIQEHTQPESKGPSVAHQSAEDETSTMTPQSSKKPKQSKRATLEPPEHLPKPASDIEEKSSTPSKTSPLKAKHKRFDSQEPDLPPPSSPPPIEPPTTTAQQETPPAASAVDDSDSDEDEAPETVTASAGQTQARAQALDEAKAATKLKEDRKLKRKERDARLKAQAKPGKKVNKDDAAEDTTPPSPTPHQHPHPPNPPLSTFLPEHILLDESPRHPPTPPPSTQKPPRNQKRKFHNLDPKPPKDIKKGGVRIRVVEEGNRMLPPKANKDLKALREMWLMGRGSVERRAVAGKGNGKGSGGFVRRVG